MVISIEDHDHLAAGLVSLRDEVGVLDVLKAEDSDRLDVEPAGRSVRGDLLKWHVGAELPWYHLSVWYYHLEFTTHSCSASGINQPYYCLEISPSVPHTLLNAGRLNAERRKTVWVVVPDYVMGSIGEGGVPRVSIAFPASKHRS